MPDKDKISELLLDAAVAIFNDGSRTVINKDDPQVKEWAKLRTIEQQAKITQLLLEEKIKILIWCSDQIYEYNHDETDTPPEEIIDQRIVSLEAALKESKQ